MNIPDPLHDEILTVDQVARLLKLTVDTIYDKHIKGEIPGAFRIGDGPQAPIRFSKRVLMEWIIKEANRP